MKNRKMLPTILYTISILILVFNVAWLLFSLLRSIEVAYIWHITTFLILSFLNIVITNKGVIRITETAARFTLDSLPGKQMAIDEDFSSKKIDESEAKHRKLLLQQDLDFINMLNGFMNVLSRITKAIIVLVSIAIIILIMKNVFDLKLFAADQFSGMIICGILSQLILLGITVYIGVIVTRDVKKPA